MLNKILNFNKTSLIIFFFVNFCWNQQVLAVPSFSSKDNKLPTVLKAENIEADQEKKILIAKGNVEISKGIGTIIANEIVYDKINRKISALGDLKLKNIEVGFLLASQAQISDDFNSGSFSNGLLFFNDGSYLRSKKITKVSSDITSLYNSIFSFCPNEEIANDYNSAGQKRDFAVIASSQTTIDRTKERVKTKHGVFKIYGVPFFYVPYISTPLASKKRESGLLSPSYAKNSNFGLGVKLPYFFAINPQLDITSTPLFYFKNNQYVINNDIRHFTKFGRYNLSLEFANNNVNNTVDTLIVERTKKNFRWQLEGKGKFDFTSDIGGGFNLNTISDRDYLRDYHFNYSAYTVSKVNIDYVKRRNFLSFNAVRFQELEKKELLRTAPFILPSIEGHFQIKPIFYKEQVGLGTNLTVLQREDGLQYRRLSLTPSLKLPYNVKGNLFEIIGRIQNDLYSLENNFKNIERNNNYSSMQSNYKSQFIFNWRLPMIKRAQKNTFMIEPMFSFISSNFKKDFKKLPNEDSNNGELSFSNIFLADRISGYDRNETGERVSYGGRASYFNKYGDFILFAGQSWRISNEEQDVAIRGFADNNKSNYVGQGIYKAKKYFNLSYLFQLNESSYNNEVNQVSSSLNFSRFSIASDYLLLKKTTYNPLKKEQISLNGSLNLKKQWKVKITAIHDMALNRTISRGITILRDGCCTNFGFSIAENNPSNLSKPQKTFNLNLSFKNL